MVAIKFRSSRIFISCETATNWERMSERIFQNKFKLKFNSCQHNSTSFLCRSLFQINSPNYKIYSSFLVSCNSLSKPSLPKYLPQFAMTSSQFYSAHAIPTESLISLTENPENLFCLLELLGKLFQQSINLSNTFCSGEGSYGKVYKA